MLHLSIKNVTVASTSSNIYTNESFNWSSPDQITPLSIAYTHLPTYVRPSVLKSFAKRTNSCVRWRRLRVTELPWQQPALDHPVDIRGQIALEQGEGPEHEPKERAVGFLKLTAGPGLIEGGIKVFGIWDSKRPPTNLMFVWPCIVDIM
jgi:hypothetical protein